MSEDARDTSARHVSLWTTREKIVRLVWAVVQATLFRMSFHTWYRWRVWLLNRFGARIDRAARIRRTVRIEIPWNITIGHSSSIGDRVTLYALGPITLADRVSISQNAHLCAGTHDATVPDLPLLRPPIIVENDVWIAADVFVGPGVTLREGSLLGARACVFKDTEPWTIYGGNPAKPLKKREFHR